MSNISGSWESSGVLLAVINTNTLYWFAYAFLTFVILLSTSLWLYFRKKKCFELVRHFETASARITAHPPYPGHHPNLLRGIRELTRSTSSSDHFSNDSSDHTNIFEIFRHECGFFQGLWWQSFTPKDREVRAVIIGVHGYSDHSDFLMLNHASELLQINDSDARVAIVLFDQPGAGRSEGLWGFIPDWFEHVDKCRQFIDLFVKVELYPGENVRFFGFGFSCGGGILVTMQAQGSNLDGMVLLAPMISISDHMKPSPYIQQLLGIMAFIFPTWPVTITNISGALSFREEGFDELVDNLNKLQYPGFPRLATAASFLTAQEWMKKQCHRVEIPFLVLHGTADVVTCIEGSRTLYESANISDKKFIVLEGYRHHLAGPGQNESFNKKPYSAIKNWLLDRIHNFRVPLNVNIQKQS